MFEKLKLGTHRLSFFLFIFVYIEKVYVTKMAQILKGLSLQLTPQKFFETFLCCQITRWS